MSALRWIASSILVVAAVGTVLWSVAQRRWRADTDAIRQKITNERSPTQPLPDRDVPNVVARYLARALPGDVVPTTAWVRQSGTFQMSEGAAGWKAFTADEVFRMYPPAFYWDAKISLAPGVSVLVRDSYVDGAARMTGKVLGLFTVVDAPNSPELRRGALARYLAESVWFPARLAVGPGLSWRAVDDSSATATLTDGDVSVSLTFSFDSAGDPVRVAGLRERAVGSGFDMTPWVGTFSDHATRNGFRIPLYGEVGWVVDGALVLYWRGRIEATEYR